MAAGRTFHVVVASVGETRYDGDAVSMTVPGAGGEMEVLAGHEPFVTTLREGIVVVRPSADEAREFIIGEGVLEVSASGAVVLL